MNYRLGRFGQIDLSKAEGGGDFLDSKNLAMQDLMQGLKWIQGNIEAEAFGGDPDNVTVFGESARLNVLYELPQIKELDQVWQDTELGDETCFRKTGNPSTEDVSWCKYDTIERNTMVITNKGLHMVKDPLGEQRELLQPFARYYLK